MPNFVDPFFGSGAVVLGRPHPPGIETANDKDAFLANFYRALQADTDAVAHYAGYPHSEPDLHARHSWLVSQRTELTARVEGAPDYYDAKIAGWWVWGICLWIGGGWCGGRGPWQVVDGQLLHLGDGGQGVHRQRLHLGNGGQGVHRPRQNLHEYLQQIADRLRHMRMCCGEWHRVLGPSVTWKQGLTGVVLDPPYSHKERYSTLYRIDEDISGAVRDWAVANGDNPLLRIVLCGYDTEHDVPDTWRRLTWTGRGGLGNAATHGANPNRHRETLWLSPHCLAVDGDKQLGLFDDTYRAEEKAHALETQPEETCADDAEPTTGRY